MRRASLALLAILSILSAAVLPCAGAEAPAGICLNEISALGVGHDWVEVYNASRQTIDGLPLVLRDTIDASGNVFPFCVSSLRPGERRIVTCPNLLNGNGEELALLDREGNLLDSAVYGRQTFNMTFGRRADGAPGWRFQYPTEGESNGSVPKDSPPVILGAPFHWPLRPAAGEPLFVSIAAVAAGELDAVELSYSVEGAAGSPWIGAACRDDGLDGDETAGDGRFTGRIPGFPAGTVLRYRIRAEDRSGNEALAPSADDSFGIRFGFTPSPIRLNEIQASNRTTGRYKYNGKYYLSDWIELYNAGDSVVDLSGWSLSDRRTTAVTFPILGEGRRIIIPGGYLLIWAQRHFPEDIPDAVGVNFSLSRNGEEIALFAEDGFSVVDAVTYPPLETDTSYGRVPDGTGEFVHLNVPTPRGGIVHPPQKVEILSYEPLLPELGEAVDVQVRISPNLAIGAAEVYYWLMDEGRAALFDDGTHGDAQAGDGVFAARIGPFQDSGDLHFAIEVKDGGGTLLRDPELETEWYRIPLSWRPAGPVKINEVFAGSYLCCCGCLAFQSLKGPLEPRNFVEIWNGGEKPLDPEGLYLTDDPLDYEKVQLAPPEGSTAIAPLGCLVAWFYAGEETEILDPAGGTLFLTDGKKIIDAVRYGEAVPGRSYGRFPQEGGSWSLGDPSPGAPNGSAYFVRGEADGNRRLNLNDAVLALLILFGSREAACLDALDADDSGKLDISDPIAVLSYLFQGGPPPRPPFPDFGPDASPDALDCRSI